jgi:hypothetical protein
MTENLWWLTVLAVHHLRQRANHQLVPARSTQDYELSSNRCRNRRIGHMKSHADQGLATWRVGIATRQ